MDCVVFVFPWPNNDGVVVVVVVCPNMFVLAAVVAGGCPKILPSLCPNVVGLQID
jgi:hypothetical protein